MVANITAALDDDDFLAVPETQMSWVVAEHVAASAGELTVSKGQQVELVEPWAARADWWVVRAAGTGEAAQGAVPAHVLKPQPHAQPPPAPHTHRKTSPSPSPSRRPLAQPDEPLALTPPPPTATRRLPPACGSSD
ncbi:hypothetical protein RR48_09003 [Papilio machaon]|uniref:SH3 domain-containing protein n=1 Tax=Papilio machaon TaxID=76193 RepID=A0A194QXS6_PAPMA|nr:hypothetical protein RR48_09003 [Papilio machaon]